MNTAQHYKRLRRKGWQASAALSDARTYALADMIGDDFVRIDVVPDEVITLDDLICQCGDEACEARDRKEIGERADRDGVWGIIGQYRTDDEDEWQHADSVWGFIGDDWQDSGYDADCLQSAIDAYLKHTNIVAAMLTLEGVGL